jgi:hypothetical protein
MKMFLTTLLVLGFLLAPFGRGDEPKKPQPKLPLGKDTTFFTEPLDKDGYLDYETALNNRLAKGITPEKNANVLLWKALGQKPEGGRGMPPEFFKALGIDEPAEKGDYIIGSYTFIKNHLMLDDVARDEFFEQQSRTVQHPWKAKDFPNIAAWLKANEKPLAVAIEASKRPDYFNPLVSFRKDGQSGGLIGALLPGVQKCRDIATLLAIRAMLRVEEGQLDDAWADLMACHRLGRLLVRGATLIESLVGIAIDQIATNAELAYLERAKLSSQQVLQRLKDLQALPPMTSAADKIDLGERCMYLDSLQRIRSGQFSASDLEAQFGQPAKKPTPEELQALDRIDWEPALRNGNKYYDRLVAALRLKDRAEREKQLDLIEAELVNLKKETTGLGGLGKLLLSKDTPEKTVGKAIGDVLIGLFIPATHKVQGAFDRAEQVQRNRDVAFALAAFRLDKERYPEKLDELAPKYLTEVPGDLFSGKGLIYRPTDKGYLIYSVGVNGKDEEGRWYDDDPPGDDPRVRMPLPAWKPQK